MSDAIQTLKEDKCCGCCAIKPAMIFLCVLIMVGNVFEVVYSFYVYFMPVPTSIKVIAALSNYLPFLIIFFLGTWLFATIKSNAYDDLKSYEVACQKLQTGLLYNVLIIVIDGLMQISAISYIQQNQLTVDEMTEE